MTRLTLWILFLAFAATSGNIARLQERIEDMDMEAPFARLGLEDGTRFANLEPIEEDPLMAELEPVQEEDEQLYAELESFEEDEDESPSNMGLSMENEELGKKRDRGCGRKHRLRNQQRRGGRRSSLRRSFAKLLAAKEDEDKSFVKLSQKKEEKKRFKKIERNDGATELSDEEPLFAKLEPSEDEEDHLLEELEVYNEEETPGREDDEQDEQELLIQSGGRHRFRQRRNQRDENKRARVLRRQSLGELRQNNKSKRFMKLSKNVVEMIHKFKDEVKKNKERRMNGRRGGRRHGGAAGGCKKSSRVCCDGSAPSRNRSAKGWPQKMTCKDGERPVCSVDQCQSWINLVSMD